MSEPAPSNGTGHPNPNANANPATASRPETLGALFWSFTWLALQGFGGVLAIVQRELVERRRWLTREQFVEDWAVAQVLPGPNIVNLSLMLGDRFFGGARGAARYGCCGRRPDHRHRHQAGASLEAKCGRNPCQRCFYSYHYRSNCLASPATGLGAVGAGWADLRLGLLATGPPDC